MQTPMSNRGIASAAPHLSLTPISHSLIDGTDFQSPSAASQSHLSPSSPAESQALSTSLAGPLSSHPVTPIDEPSPSAEMNFDSYNWSRKNAANDTSNSQNNPDSYRSALSHKHNVSDDSNNFDPALPPHQPSRDTSRRPSLVERFMPRLRSASFLKSRSRSSLGKFNDSSTSLSQRSGRGNTGDGASAASTVEDLSRGTKRPASPADGRPQSRGAASTFPRMLRKKSLELLSTARRRSAMWGESGTGTTVSAFDEERERERLREEELQEEEKQQRLAAIRAELDKKPAPKLPELPSLGSVTGGHSLVEQDLFSNIGR